MGHSPIYDTFFNMVHLNTLKKKCQSPSEQKVTKNAPHFSLI